MPRKMSLANIAIGENWSESGIPSLETGECSPDQSVSLLTLFSFIFLQSTFVFKKRTKKYRKFKFSLQNKVALNGYSTSQNSDFMLPAFARNTNTGIYKCQQEQGTASQAFDIRSANFRSMSALCPAAFTAQMNPIGQILGFFSCSRLLLYDHTIHPFGRFLFLSSPFGQ